MKRKIKKCPYCRRKADVWQIPWNDAEEDAAHPGWYWNDAGMWAIGCDTPGCYGNINHKAMVFLTAGSAIHTWNRRGKRAL